MCTEESGDISFYLEEFLKCFPGISSQNAILDSFNFPAQLLINSFAVTRLVEETLLSTVPETVTDAIIFPKSITPLAFPPTVCYNILLTRP